MPPSETVNGCVIEEIKRYFYFKLDNNFCLLEMDRQDSYLQPEFDYEGDNFLTNLLNESNTPKELLNLGESTDLKECGLMIEDSQEPEPPASDCKDILDKQEYNRPLPENLFQEHGDESILMIAASSRQPQSDCPSSSKKECKLDKLAYQEETRLDKIQRYRHKKTRRIWDRKVFYDCRKVVADNRERINGRFVKKSPLMVEKRNNHKNSLATEELEIIKDYSEAHRSDFANFILE